MDKILTNTHPLPCPLLRLAPDYQETDYKNGFFDNLYKEIMTTSIYDSLAIFACVTMILMISLRIYGSITSWARIRSCWGEAIRIATPFDYAAHVF